LRYTTTHPQGTPEIISVFDLNSLFSFEDATIYYQPTGTAVSESENMVISLDLAALLVWYRCLSPSCLQKIAKAHNVVVINYAKATLQAALHYHTCNLSCRGVCYIFKPVRQRPMSTILNKFGSVVIDTPLLVPCTFLSPQPQVHPVIHDDACLRESTIGSVNTIHGACDIDQSQSVSFLTQHIPLQAEFTEDPLHALDYKCREMIIKEWQHEMSTKALKPSYCAICGVCIFASESSFVDASAVNLTLLRNDDIPVHIQPTDYDFHLYQRAYLCAKGMESTTVLGKLRICASCKASLSDERMPKFALSNYLYYGHQRLPSNITDAIEKSSMFERMLIARARSNSICCKFSARENKLVTDEERARDILGNVRKGIRGNVIVSPLDTVKMNSVIPPGPAVIRDTMCAVFVGAVLPTKSSIHEYSPILVQRSRVKLLIEFLLANNPHYREDESFSFHSENLDALFNSGEDEELPVSAYVGLINVNDALDATTSDYTERNRTGADEADADDPLLMENVGYTDGDDTPTNYRVMKATALEHCVSGRPFIASGRGSALVPDFNNPSILTWLFPHLDPWGIGGFYHPNRKIPITMEDQLSHLLRSYDKRFQQDPEFAFVFFNVVRKALVSRTMRFSVPLDMHRNLVSSLLNIRPEVLEKLNIACRKDPFYKPVHEEEREAFKLLASLGMTARYVPGSNSYKVAMRNEIRALIISMGAPTLFVTLNPSDVDNPIVRLLTGENIDLEDVYRGEDMNEWRRKVLAARNPAACAQFFDLMVNKFIRIVLRYDRAEPGAFGRCIGYYGTVEAQGKGTLHCHMLIWLRGHLSPQGLREKVASSPEYKAKYIKWLESVVSCEFPLQIDEAKDFGTPYSTRIQAKDTGAAHPGVVPAPILAEFGSDKKAFWSAYFDFVDRLLYEYNWHDHQPTCWKSLRSGEQKSDANCRMGMDGSTRAETILDATTSAVLLRRLHPYIASYTDISTFLLKCNVNTKYVGSGQAAKSFAYYLTDYITKYSLPLHVGMAALLHAVQRTNARIPEGVFPTDKQQIGAITTAVNSMMGKQEISHQQVMSYLIGGGDHYTKHKFQIIHWGSIFRYVESKTRESTGTCETAEIPPEDLPEQRVGLAMGIQEIHASSQLLDYIHRGTSPEYEKLCLYQFFAETSKRRIGPGIDIQSDRPGFFNSWDHPQRLTHELHFRRKVVVPVLLGPSTPNPRVSPEAGEIWAKHMLALFKPWRNPENLRPQELTWREAYQNFSASLDARLQEIVDNMTVLSESRDARNEHASQRRQDNSELEDAVACSLSDVNLGGAEEEGELGQIVQNTENVFDVLSGIVSDPVNSNLLLNKIVDMWAGHGISRCLDLCGNIEDSGIHASQDDVSGATQGDEEVMRNQYKEMRALKKRPRVSTDYEEGIVDKRRRWDISESSKSPIATRTILKSDRVSWEIQCTEEESSILTKIVGEMNLASNPEQLRAFRLIANKVISQSQEQMLLYVSGVGGTGKSHVIQCIIKLFNMLGRRRELALAAPTGIAAVLIGGQTLHSLLKISPNGKALDVGPLTESFRDTSTIVLDEVSMVDARLLNTMSIRMRIGKGEDLSVSGRPFGGMDVIFMGDFGQLKPPVEHSLYSHKIVSRPSFTDSNIRGQEAMNGIWLWRQVWHVVELVHNHRQSADLRYAAFLKRLRLGACNRSGLTDSVVDDDFAYLLPRLLFNLSKDPEKIRKFHGAPVIVGTRSLRDAINAKLLVRHTLEIRQKVYVYHSTDSSFRRPVAGSLRTRLWDLSSSITGDSLGRLPLFKGMRVMIMENLAIEYGIVNGREGTVRDIKYTVDSRGRRIASVVYVYVEGCGLNMTGRSEDTDIVPIFPTSKTVSSKSTLRFANLNSFSRKQIPLLPAYSYTDFKAQGRSLNTIIADIHTARGQGVYVMLSRVRTLDGLAILRPFQRNKITSRLPEELRLELARLEDLGAKTKEYLESQ